MDSSAWDKELGRVPRRDHPVDCEVIYIGGGNAALLFRDIGTAKCGVYAWSKELLDKAPGLRVAVGHAEVDPEAADGISKAYKDAVKVLEACSEALPLGSPLLALPVSLTCSTTGLPASCLYKGEYLSSESMRKREAVGDRKNPGDALERVNSEFEEVLGSEGSDGRLEFPLDFEELGGKKGESHIAVVHADGNGIGTLLNEVIANPSGDDETFLGHVREFSASVARVARDAFQQTLVVLKGALPDLEDRGLSLQDKIFPVRPIVYGGDDLTFVCDGRLGLPLAAAYLERFAGRTVDVNGVKERVDACAGVAVVPTKFPFARACRLAEELCASAKRARREERVKNPDSPASWLDFQIVLSATGGSLDQIRSRQYVAATGDELHLRPWPMGGGWSEFVKSLEHFTGEWPRSRAKGLLGALAGGPEETEIWLELARSRGYTLPASEDVQAQQRGWGGGSSPGRRTPYFDPLEALDFYMDIGSGAAASDHGSDKQ